MEDMPLQPPDDLEILNHLLGRARYFILDLIGFLDTALERLGNIPLSARVVRYLTRRALLPAEAALRRAIILMVPQLEPAPAAPARAPAKASARPPAPRPQAAASPRAPLFRMSEPQSRPVKYPEANYLPEDLMPRITLLTDAVLRARPAAALPPVPRDPAAAFRRRFEALRAAYEDPASVARRWRRRCAASAATAARTLSSGKIPGAARSLGQNALSLLQELTQAARTTPLLNTS